jgi:chromosome segregation ATPase
MRKTFFRNGRNWLAFLLVMLFVVTVGAQQKRRPSRRRTHPIIASPTPTPAPSTVSKNLDPKIVSTADGLVSQPSLNTQPSLNGGVKSTTTGLGSGPEPDSMLTTVDRLSKQVTNLNEKLSAMEEDQRSLGNLERLSRAQQRSEDLRAQLRDVQSKQLDYQARMEQVDLDLRPENIDASISGIGTTHPEEVRNQRRFLLQNEKKRIQAQLDLLDKSRIRLETAVETSELEIEKLRERIEGSKDPVKARVEKPIEKPSKSDDSEPPLP